MGVIGRELRYGTYRGREIEAVAEALAQLRITVFRDFPYLYDGTVAYEKTYLQTYINAESSFLFAAFDGERLIGATTCILLADETADVQEPFLQKERDTRKIFYCGESILLKEYRGRGLGHRFFEERESHAKAYGGVDYLCFCAVKRAVNHPLRPVDYRPLDDFWIRRGYRKDTEMVSYFEWKDICEEAPSSKIMEYWFKKI